MPHFISGVLIFPVTLSLFSLFRKVQQVRRDQRSNPYGTTHDCNRYTVSTTTYQQWWEAWKDNREYEGNTAGLGERLQYRVVSAIVQEDPS